MISSIIYARGTMQDALIATPSIPLPVEPTHPSTSLLHRLPPELIDQVLTHIPPQLLQRTALSLTQVFPPDTLSARHVWTHLIVHRAAQLMPLWRKLKTEGEKGERGSLRHVKTFCQVSKLCVIGAEFPPRHLGKAMWTS
jgi:hypothetical protein